MVHNADLVNDRNHEKKIKINNKIHDGNTISRKLSIGDLIIEAFQINIWGVDEIYF